MGGEDSFILKLDGHKISLDHTPNSLGMSDHIELLCVPAVKVDVHNFWTRKIESSFVMESTDTFHMIHNMCVKMRGSNAFVLSFHGRRLKLRETPSSLGMKNHVELTCVPVPMVEIVIKDAESPGYESTFPIRRDQKLSDVYLKYKEMKGDGSFFFIYCKRKLSLRETPESLGMNDQVDFTCVSSSTVIVDVFNIETQEVDRTMLLKSSSSFKRVFKACEDQRPHCKAKPRSSFFLEFRGTRIDCDADTPNALGMSVHSLITYIPNPIVVINLYDKYGGFLRTFRLKRYQPLHVIFETYNKLSFYLMFRGDRIHPIDTPDSLGMKDHEDIAWVGVVSIHIHNNESNKVEHIFQATKVISILDYTKEQRTDTSPFYLITQQGKRIRDTDTPGTLLMDGRVKIFLVHFVTIDIRNSESQEVDSICLDRSATFEELYDKYKKKSGHVLFDFTFNGVIVDLAETPISLGLNNHADFVCVPSLVKISIRDKVSGEIEHHYRGSRAATFSSIREEIAEKRNDNSSFLFRFAQADIDEDATPNSLNMGDEEEILLVPYVIFRIQDIAKKIVASFKTEKRFTFWALIEWHLKGESCISDYDYHYKDAIIDLDDTFASLGKDLVEVVRVPRVSNDPPEKVCCCTYCRKRKAEVRLDEEAGEDTIEINIVFVDTSSSADKLVLRHGYDEKMKTLLSRYALMRDLPLKSLRFKYEDRMLFVSSIGNKSPHDLGMRNNDVVYASRLTSSSSSVSPEIRNDTKSSKLSQGTGTKKEKIKGKGKGKGKKKAKCKKRAPTQPTYSTMDEEERLRRAHSKLLSRVFDEANPIFKKTRQHLNSLALEQTPPKSKSSSPRVREPTAADPSDISSLSLGNKAIKTRFNILAGEVSNLYKSTKPSKKMKAQATRESITIDLHGYTKEAAVEILDASLPSWIDTAMHGNYPFVVPVAIICGAGGQVLSEVVEQWIRENERVTNARKNMFI
eukprot:scaffold10013_cov79-Skeletonema_dohrnii-CCMP3373.AAC.36